MKREIALFEWSADGTPILLGRLTDPDLVAQVRDRLAKSLIRELRELGEPSVRLVDDE